MAGSSGVGSCPKASTRDANGRKRRLVVPDSLGPQNQVLQELCFIVRTMAQEIKVENSPAPAQIAPISEAQYELIVQTAPRYDQRQDKYNTTSPGIR